jgi:hypothetical protein
MSKLKLIILITIALFVFGCIISIANSEELYSYKVHGQNVKTGLMVAGQVWESDKSGNIIAKVWDEFDIHEQCAGSWVGYGVAKVSCDNGNEYVLEVSEP